MEATEPMEVPVMARVSGMTMTISMMKGTERRKLMITLITFISSFGMGRMPFSSPVTSSMPRGRPITMANSVASTVTYTVSHRPSGNSVRNTCQASCSLSGSKAFKNWFMP